MGKFQVFFFSIKNPIVMLWNKKVQWVELQDLPGRVSATMVKSTGDSNAAPQLGLSPASTSQKFAGIFLV